MATILWYILMFCAFSAIFAITVLVGWWIWKLVSSIGAKVVRRRFSVAGYHCFYLTMKDVLKIRKFIAGISSDIDETAADVNRDGSVDMKDVLLIRKFIAGLIASF